MRVILLSFFDYQFLGEQSDAVRPTVANKSAQRILGR